MTYAAASVNQGAKDRKAYADFIRYAAGPGQTPGLSAGELPPGYAPLTTKLRAQAEAAADDLERGAAVGRPSSEPDPDDPGGGTRGSASGGRHRRNLRRYGRAAERPSGGAARR